MKTIMSYVLVVFGIVVALVGLYRLVAFHGEGELLSGILVLGGAAAAFGGKRLANRLKPVVDLVHEAEGKGSEPEQAP